MVKHILDAYVELAIEELATRGTFKMFGIGKFDVEWVQKRLYKPPRKYWGERVVFTPAENIDGLETKYKPHRPCPQQHKRPKINF